MITQGRVAPANYTIPASYECVYMTELYKAQNSSDNLLSCLPDIIIAQTLSIAGRVNTEIQVFTVSYTAAGLPSRTSLCALCFSSPVNLSFS